MQMVEFDAGLASGYPANILPVLMQHLLRDRTSGAERF
jgi:hypothetical protein